MPKKKLFYSKSSETLKKSISGGSFFQIGVGVGEEEDCSLYIVPSIGPNFFRNPQNPLKHPRIDFEK